MYTLATKNFTVIYYRSGPHITDEVLDLPDMDAFFTEHAGKHDRDKAERERIELDAARVWQERFFATLCLPVPPEALEHPLQMRECHMDPVLYHRGFGISMRIHRVECGRPFIVYKRGYQTVRVEDGGTPHQCHGDKVAPWLLRLFVNDDPEIVWRAFQGSVRRDEHRDRVDAICCAHDLSLSGATFARSAQQGVKNAVHMHVDGAVVCLYPDHFEVVISPEKLTPWSKMVLARPDAHAILSEIARAVEH